MKYPGPDSFAENSTHKNINSIQILPKNYKISKIFPIPLWGHLPWYQNKDNIKRGRKKNCKPISLMNIDNEKP